MLSLFSPAIFMGPAQRRLAERGVPVLAYHKIAQPPPDTRDPFLYDTPARFNEQLSALREAGFTSAALAELPALPDNRPRKVVITFDDGCLNVLEHGLEILARHQFRAIQFLVPAFLGRRNEWDVAKGDVPEQLMNESQVRDWLAAGNEIGSHSMNHRNLRRLTPDQAREEILGSKKALEDRFGLPVRHFSYPFGMWNEVARDLVAEAGYETACTMQFGVNVSSTPQFELCRIFPLSSSEMLRKIIHRLRRKVSA